MNILLQVAQRRINSNKNLIKNIVKRQENSKEI